MKEDPSRAAALALLAAWINVILGSLALWLGVTEGAVALWGFGAACVLQVPPALSLRGRIREGLGNKGLDRERITLRVTSHFLRLLALGMTLTSVSALLGERAPQSRWPILGLAFVTLGIQAAIWFAKRRLTGIHPALDLDATRTRILLELAALLLMGNLAGYWFPWADAVSGLAQALCLFLGGRTLAKATTLQAACGGCGSGCG